MGPVIPLAVKVACLFDTVAALHGNWLTRRVLAIAKQLTLAALPEISDWAAHLVTSGRVADGVNSLRKWLKERIKKNTPRWLRMLTCPVRRVDQICDWILGNEDELLAEIRAKAQPPQAIGY